MKKYTLLLTVVLLANSFVFAQCSGGADYICGNENPTTGSTNYYTVINVSNATTYHWWLYDYSNQEGPSDEFFDRVTTSPSIDINFSVPNGYFLICYAYNGIDYIRGFYDILIAPEFPSLKRNSFKISNGVAYLQLSSSNFQPHLWNNMDSNVN